MCLRSFLFIALICLSISSFSATLSQLQKGTTTFPAASGSTTQAISNVNLDETFLVFSIRVADNAPGDFQISGYFSDTDELTFTRQNVGGSPAVTIEWRVISFSSGVYVQHGTATNVGGGGVNVTLSSIDTNESFAIVTMHKDGGQYGSDDGINANITSQTNLFIDRENGGGTIQFVRWQVIEWSGANVQKLVNTLPMAQIHWL